jgi:hypothetical protein
MYVNGVQFAAHHAVMTLIHEYRSGFDSGSRTVFSVEQEKDSKVKITFRLAIDASQRKVKLVVSIAANGHATNYLTYEHPSSRDVVLLRFTVGSLNGYRPVPRLVDQAAAPDEDGGNATEKHAWRHLANRLVIAYGVRDLGTVQMPFGREEVSFLSLLE